MQHETSPLPLPRQRECHQGNGNIIHQVKAGTPLYDQTEIDANIAAERERCAKVCDAIAYEWRGANSQSVQCADAIRKGE